MDSYFILLATAALIQMVGILFQATRTRPIPLATGVTEKQPSQVNIKQKHPKKVVKIERGEKKMK